MYLAPVRPRNRDAESSCGKYMAQAVKGQQVQADSVEDLERRRRADCALLR